MIETENSIKNRTGAMYRDYADGKFKSLLFVDRAIVDDIIKISMALPPCRGDANNLTLLGILERMYTNKQLPQDLLIFVSIVFNFGYMQGGNAVRNTHRERKSARKHNNVNKTPCASL